MAHLSGSGVSSNSPEAYSLNKKSHFGEKVGEKIQYLLVEAIFLVHEGKMNVLSKNKVLKKDELVKRFQRIDSRFYTKYIVFSDLRKKGYVLKTALKFGADFRVYEKNSYSKKDGHSKWILFAEQESKKFSFHEFSAKNRVAHSTRKNLLLAVIDEEEDVTYYEVRWIKP